MNNDKWEQFIKIWAKGKNNSQRNALMQKVSLRGLEPTEENCRDFYMGYVRYYKNEWTGEEFHINPRKNKQTMKQLRRSRNAKNQQRRKGGGRKPHHVGNRHSQKKRKV